MCPGPLGMLSSKLLASLNKYFETDDHRRASAGMVEAGLDDCWATTEPCRASAPGVEHLEFMDRGLVMAHRTLILSVMIVLLECAVAYPQERAAGAGRVEAAFYPAGGIFFTEGPNKSEPSFGDYALGLSGTYNINRWVGLEGEFGGGVGVKQNIDFARGTFSNIKPPHMIAYNGDLVVHPGGNNRPVVPYVAGGIGGLTLVDTDSVHQFGLTKSDTFLSGNAGAGLKWFSSRGWGVRGDYRFFATKGKDDASPFFGLQNNRYGHRINASIVLTR